MLHTKWWRIAAVAGLGLLAGAAAGRAAGERPPTYVWLFSATGAEVESLADAVTEEFEESFVKAGCLPIVQRRNLPDLQSHQKQEERIEGADSLSPRQRRLLSTASADAVVFGKITDDVQGGQVKIAVTLETLAGVTLANTSVRISRGKRLDAEERERRMAELATEVCGALGFKKKDSVVNGQHGSDPGSVPESAILMARFGNVTYRIVSAQHTGHELQVWLVATNSGANLETVIFHSTLTDTSGNENRITEAMAGGKRESYRVTLPYNVLTRIGLAFSTVAPNVTTVPYLQIETVQGVLEFRNIPVPYRADQ
jgi:hypothetical protein